MSALGTIFRVALFGESHGPGVGAVVEGVPAGMVIDVDLMKRELARRRPGQSKLTTQRKEEDEPEFLSGVMKGAATGARGGGVMVKVSSGTASLVTVDAMSHRNQTFAGESLAKERACFVPA